MFYGINGEQDTRYADYYIVNQAAAGKEGYEGIVFTDSAGNILTAAEVDKNNDGTISVEEKSGLTVDQDAFNTKFEELRANTDPNFIREYTSGLKNFLLNVGMDQYNAGKIYKASTSTPTSKEEPNRKIENEFKRGLRRTSREIKALYDENLNKGSFTYNFGPDGNKVEPGAKPGSIKYSIPTNVAGEYEVREYDSYNDWWASESGWPEPRKYVPLP